MKINRFLTLPILLLSSGALAQTVDESEASLRALNFLSREQQVRGINHPVKLTLAHKAATLDETYYYVFNSTAGGFVIVGGDEQAAEVLGYSEQGSFDIDRIPDNMRWWLDTYQKAISRNIQAQRTSAEPLPRRATTYYSPVEPLLGGTEWSQHKPYNLLIPGNSPSLSYEDEYVTGCVATAVSQVMRYHRWPSHGWGRKSYQLNGYTYEANFAATTYNWNLMHDTYSSPYTNTSAELEVAKLMYHVGVAADMAYDLSKNGGSGAVLDAAVRGLRTYFGYTEAEIISRDVDDDSWEKAIVVELQHGRPVIYSGRTAGDTGHSFVCDGYKQGRFHINWGWGGSYNGYFLVTPTSTESALTPAGTGTGGGVAGSSYTQSQRIVTKLQPDPSYDGGLICTDIVMPNKGNYAIGEPFEIGFKLENTSSSAVTLVDPLIFFFPVSTGGGSVSSVGYIEYAEVTVPAQSSYFMQFTDEYGTPSCLTQPTTLNVRLDDYQKTRGIGRTTITMCNLLDVDYVMGNDGWNTLCLPFDAPVPSQLTAYEVTEVRSNGTLVKREVPTLQMNQPYLVRGKAGTYHFHGPETERGTYQHGLLFGTTKKTGEYVPKNAYALKNKTPDGVAFYQVTMGYTERIGCYNAYLQTEVPVGNRILIDSDNGIHEVEMDPQETTELFDLMGRTTTSSAGLLIRNGKVVFVR